MTALRSTLASKHKVLPFIFILDGDSRKRKELRNSSSLRRLGVYRIYKRDGLYRPNSSILFFRDRA